MISTCRTSSKDIHKICRGFFSDPGHLAAHFEWLSNVSSLNETVEKNLFRQLGWYYSFFERFQISLSSKIMFILWLFTPSCIIIILDLMLDYLKHVDRSIGFKEKLDKIDIEVETDYGASRIYRDIYILVRTFCDFSRIILRLEPIFTLARTWIQV